MSGRESKRILIVEDEPLLAGLLCRTLQSRLSDGYQVEICPLVEEAIARLQHWQFDLIVTDLRMPDDTSGLELIRHVRQVSPQTRTVLITAYPSPGIEAQVRQLAIIYLPKPFEMREFVATVQHALTMKTGTVVSEGG